MPPARPPARIAWLTAGMLALALGPARAEPFDAAPFALPLPEGTGLLWEDPREIHRVVAHFATNVSVQGLRLEYWGSWWPERHLPKDREPGGGDIGWLELGNWWKGGWRTADTHIHSLGGNPVVITFQPVHREEFPTLTGYHAPFRYTLKLRLVSDRPLPPPTRFEAFTDSQLQPRSLRVVWRQPPATNLLMEAFNGRVTGVETPAPDRRRVHLLATTNPDPNTFDLTLLTIRAEPRPFTVRIDDLAQGPILLPDLGVAVLPDDDPRDYRAVEAAQKARGERTLYDRVSTLPEQTWPAAWAGMPPKKSSIYFPLGLDGGRQRFRLNADGSLDFRSNDPYLRARPGQDTPRLDLEPGPVKLAFELPATPAFRTLEEETLPICTTEWDVDFIRVRQTAFVAPLEGLAEPAPSANPAPPADAFAVLLARFTFTNTSTSTRTAALPLRFKAADQARPWTVQADGQLLAGEQLRGLFTATPAPQIDGEVLRWPLAPGEQASVVIKLPYCLLLHPNETNALARLDFDAARREAADYWRTRLDTGARLTTPEPMLNQFYRSQAMHLLVNCEREPSSDRRFARVGSFAYGAYGNESCMMVVDLDRRGFHREASDCLEAWLHYQGTVALPGSFAGHEGVFYGAGGYEAGGYNQHHGWILWMFGEHYRFTRDQAWLRHAAPGIVKGADWIIRETARTADRHPLERGLLPAGSLEDIGDWWTWLSTSCYTWRGLDTAAWALAQIDHPEAPRIRQAALAYHQALLTNFRLAAERTPVVRLRDGTAVPKFPSHVHRRGRSFGWICETLEGALHLLITGALDPRAPEAAWILKDYEDNLYLSNQYGYTLEDFDRYWFGRGGMSMQACLLLDVEPYLYRDDVKHALRSLFNGQAVSYFPDVCMNTEHALPEMGDWRGDQFKTSDESNAAGWLRYLLLREEGDTLLVGQAVPRDWLAPGQACSLENAATWFGPASILYTGGDQELSARLQGPMRNPPAKLRLRFRHPQQKPIARVTVNGQPWTQFHGEWVDLPGNVGTATVVAGYAP